MKFGIKNRFLETIISITFQFLYGLKDPLSGFKVYKTKILKEKNFKEIGNYFLVDFLLTFIKKIQKLSILKLLLRKETVFRGLGT